MHVLKVIAVVAVFAPVVVSLVAVYVSLMDIFDEAWKDAEGQETEDEYALA